MAEFSDVARDSIMLNLKDLKNRLDIDLGEDAEGNPGEEENKDKNTLKSCLEIRRNPRVSSKHPLNCIIYGAPGTGKTYSTAEYALAIIENREVDKSKKSDDQRRALMKLLSPPSVVRK